MITYVVYDMGMVMIAIGLHPIVVFMSGQDKGVNWMRSNPSRNPINTEFKSKYVSLGIRDKRPRYMKLVS
jgi:hypothetical protein